ncbi:MAG: AlpA family phage regulatory protein [Qipengyuania sp.]|uniref:helix-turn-helix transcriptional regulator n=1 Tax=Qipengyuania sp. TaxID=2004515 RepID=UPI003002C79B
MTRFLSPKDTCDRIALSRATLDRMVAAGTFPKPIKLTERRLAFNASDVEAWMEKKAAAA